MSVDLLQVCVSRVLFAHCVLLCLVVIAYVMHAKQWSYEKAVTHVRECRQQVRPNPAFVQQLQQFEKRLHAARSKQHTAKTKTKQQTTTTTDDELAAATSALSVSASSAAESELKQPAATDLEAACAVAS